RRDLGHPATPTAADAAASRPGPILPRTPGRGTPSERSWRPALASWLRARGRRISVGARDHPVPERQADARPGVRHLRNAMLPLALRLAAGDEQVSAAELESHRAPATLGPEQEPARLAERDEHHDRLLDR